MPSYSTEDISRAWAAFNTLKVLRVLKDGRWHTTVVDGSPQGRIDGTQAQVRPLKDAMDFPEFLEGVWKP